MNGESSKEPQVSVVMPVFDPDPAFFRRAVISVLEQSLPDLELIVVERTGGRPAAPLLAELGDARIRHVAIAGTPTIAASRSRGLELARADLVAMCDADDVWEPARLAEQVAFLTAHPEVAVVGSSIRLIDEHDEIDGTRSYPTDHAAILAAMPIYNPLAQSSVTMRRGVVLAAGGYPDRADCICEDYELWSRLAHRGARFANLERPLVLYRLHRGAMKSRRLRATIRDTLWIKRTYWRDRPGLRAWLRRWGERALLLLPTRLVHGLFVRTTFRRAREEGR